MPRLPQHAAVPLDYFLTHFWIALGRSEAWVRLPAVMLGTLTLPVAYQLGRKLLDKSAALIFMTLLALSPFHIRYSQEVRPYALLVLGVMLAGYAFWQLRYTRCWRYVIILQIGVLIFSLAHFFATAIFIPWLIFAGVDLLFARSQRSQVWFALRSLIVSGAVAVLVILVLGWGRTLWNVSWWGFGQAVIQTERFVRDATEKPNADTGPQLTEKFIKNEILSPLGADNGETKLRLFNGLVGLGLVYLLTQKRYKLSLFLLLWLVVPIIIVIAFLLERGSFFASRYIIFVLPAYLTLLAAGILALPRWLKCTEPQGVSNGVFIILAGLVFTSFVNPLQQLYDKQEKEDWRLVAQLLTQNAEPGDAVIAVNAESTLNWYYPLAIAAPNQFDTLEAVQAKVGEAERSWIVMSIFTIYIPEGKRIKMWLDEQGAARLVLDPIITVYYLRSQANPPQLLAEVRDFALPVDHVLYAELARQNYREPTVAWQYYQIALENAPTQEIRAEYQAAIDALITK